MNTPVEDLDPIPDVSTRDWRYWRTPVLFGAGFCALQVALFVVRFGFRDASTAGPVAWVPVPFGLVLFFAGGLLVGLLAQRLVRGCHGAWRTFLLVAIAIATPFAVVLVGIPVLIRKVWLWRKHKGT